MAKGLRDLLSQHHKFGAQNNLPSEIQGHKFETPDLQELAVRVKSILASAGDACRVSEIENDYKQLFGKRLPVRELGSTNALELLKKLSDACEIDESKGEALVSVKNTQKTAHLIKLVKKSKKKPKSVSVQNGSRKDIFVPFTVQDEVRRILYGRRNIRKIEFFNLLRDKFDLKFMNLEVSPDTLIRSLPHILINDGAYVKSAYQIKKSEIEVPKDLQIPGQLVMPSYRLGHFESQVSQNLSALLEEKKQINVINIPHYYFKKFGKDLKWNQFGFEDLWRFLQLLPGDFSLFKSNSGYVVAASVVPGTEDIRDFHEKDLCGSSVYEEVLDKIRKLVLHVNIGLNSKHFRTAYETLYFEKLIIGASFDKFLNELHDQYAFQIKEIGASRLLFPCSIYNIHELKEKKIKEVEKLQLAINVLKHEDSLKSLKFPEVINANKQQFCAACVSFVETPSNFYLRILGLGPNHQMELTEKFNCLTESMQELYSFCSEEYDIPLCDLRLNMVCAGNVKGEWQRVEIIDILNTARILVKSVDYGRCHKVTMTNLKYLLKQFSELPILAYQATLFNIRPVEDDWSLEAILKFRRLTVEDNVVPKPLSVLIVHRSEKRPMQVVLSDTSRNEVMHIGDSLVDQGLAFFKFEDKAYTALYS